jgi:hypothetical protein
MLLVLTSFVDKHHISIAKTLPKTIETIELQKRKAPETATFGAGNFLRAN